MSVPPPWLVSHTPASDRLQPLALRRGAARGQPEEVPGAVRLQERATVTAQAGRRRSRSPGSPRAQAERAARSLRRRAAGCAGNGGSYREATAPSASASRKIHAHSVPSPPAPTPDRHRSGLQPPPLPHRTPPLLSPPPAALQRPPLPPPPRQDTGPSRTGGSLAWWGRGLLVPPPPPQRQGGEPRRPLSSRGMPAMGKIGIRTYAPHRTGLIKSGYSQAKSETKGKYSAVLKLLKASQAGSSSVFVRIQWRLRHLGTSWHLTASITEGVTPEVHQQK
ncbi:serine/arginine repetitive matrix protein 1-like [Dermochelys coriacea]|uniref:serine/arginine repetitive matrix protein 1-like n=1 Tax=Dermochelys coriacea TaxID=27794 RepID=UPI001CA81B0A|nr:serine/arginine repetitive matrix protein 1-like [Dermochelys coriacea]